MFNPCPRLSIKLIPEAGMLKQKRRNGGQWTLTLDAYGAIEALQCFPRKPGYCFRAKNLKYFGTFLRNNRLQHLIQRKNREGELRHCNGTTYISVTNKHQAEEPSLEPVWKGFYRLQLHLYCTNRDFCSMKMFCNPG